MTTVEDFLEQSGVKGMKWGVRKPAGKPSADYKRTAPYRKRKPHELTNKQLKETNERLNLEQNYKRMNPTTVKKGHKAVKAAMAGGFAGIAVYNAVKSPAGQSAISAGKKFLERAGIAAFNASRSPVGRAVIKKSIKK